MADPANELPKSEERDTKTPERPREWEPFQTLRREIDRVFENFHHGLSAFGRTRMEFEPLRRQPYGYLSALPQSLGEHSGRLLFAANAGMYHPDYRPVGLYVENGQELVRANTKAGPGNFHMRPNGVLYVSPESAGVLETGSFLKQKPRADFATQSGPMLVINGRLHPRFARNGGSQKYRTGVGSQEPRTLVFAISETEVSFGEFARLFRDKLRCKNALFLDGGSATSFYSLGLGRNSNLVPLGPMIGVYERAN